MTTGDSTLVASRRPPSPTSHTATSTRGVAEELERDRGRRLEKRWLASTSAAVAHGASHERADVGDCAARAVRRDRPAVDHEALGEIDEVRRRVAAACDSPAARSAESTMAVTEPLPLVPATWTSR